MCRSIKRLRGPGGPATEDEIHDAALQFVRKVSGFRTPTARHAEAFEAAVAAVSAATRDLLTQIEGTMRRA
ncbi:MAG: DUF2277 domain-containing protein [Dehalococcoidia bacterium]